MICDHDKKYQTITRTISTRIKEINRLYRSGPSLYFYQRITALRKQYSSIESFLSNEYNLEILYATLVSLKNAPLAGFCIGSRISTVGIRG